MRLQITINDEIVKKIDKYAKLIGVSRSAMCATWIGQGVMGYDKANELINGQTVEFLKDVTNEK